MTGSASKNVAKVSWDPLADCVESRSETCLSSTGTALIYHTRIYRYQAQYISSNIPACGHATDLVQYLSDSWCTKDAKIY